MTDRILEIGSAGLESTDQRVKKLMDNMVNSEVPGYKTSGVVTRSFPLELEAASQKVDAMKPQVEDSFYSNIKGALIKTDSKLDLALGSEGYFVLAAPWGEGYTRDGRFRLDKDGRLLSASGNFPVMGKGGPIIVSPGADVEINQSGDVIVDKIVVDRFRVVDPENKNALEAVSGNLFKRKDMASVILDIDSPRVLQGYVEASNVNIVDQMMEMIFLEKLYNIDTKLIQTRDANLARAMELGKPTQ